jgi:F0F1-type ATP synthase assembly protein I
MAYSDKDRKYLLLGLRIVGEFGFIIAAPVVFLTILGKRLDQRYNSAPLFLVSGFVLAASLSAVSIYRRAKRLGEEYLAIDSKVKSKEEECASEQSKRKK